MTAGAVLTGWNLDAIMYVGVAPDGASMKVFLTGRGCPLFVTPNTDAAGYAGYAGAPGNKAASESGGGRLKGMAICSTRQWVPDGAATTA